MQPDIVQTLLSSVYFDDFNTGGCTLREVFDLYVNAKTILKKKVHFIFVDLNPIRKSSIFKRFRRQKTFTRTKNVSINSTKTSDAFTFDLKEIRNKFTFWPIGVIDPASYRYRNSYSRCLPIKSFLG